MSPSNTFWFLSMIRVSNQEMNNYPLFLYCHHCIHSFPSSADFGPVTRTTDADEMKREINELTPNGGGDIPEMSLSGLRVSQHVILISTIRNKCAASLKT